MHAHSHTEQVQSEGVLNDPISSQHKSCLQPVRTMINNRNIRPRWSNVNHHPHSAKGARNPYMATLWQWRMLSPSGAGFASTSHLSYLSELSFQSIRQADIWMVFNILVGTTWKWRKDAWGVCVFERERWGERWEGESKNEWLFERDVGLYMFVCTVKVWGGGGGLMKSWVDADTHTHTQSSGTIENPWRYWSQPLFRLSTESESKGEISPKPSGWNSPSPCKNLHHNQQI